MNTHKSISRQVVQALLVGAVFCGMVPSASQVASGNETIQKAKPLEPEQAIDSFVLAPGLKMELVACEPEVIDPVSIRFDEDGRLWVVEMRDYPTGAPEGEPPLSKIRVLEDRDHDGRYETSRVFAEQLLFPTGVQPWRGGAFVTLAGEIAYLKDTDGDGRADSKETWFTGFAEKNTQLRANHPTLGLDGKIYVANGLRGGSVVPADNPDLDPLDIRSHDFRFDPKTRTFEKIAGHSQHGMTLDDFGNRFLCSNRNPLMHVVVENWYSTRNPKYALPAVIEDVAKAGEESRIFPLGRSWTTSLLHAGQFTAACGTTIYRGTGLPSEMYGNSFTCDPTGSLVHREILKPAGGTFQGKPGRQGVEFLASHDEWCRPVDLRHGPDGALYVVDMYRAVIEHPQWMPDELRQRPDLRDGDTRGRIYRIVAEGYTNDHEKPQLSQGSSVQLVEYLNHENAWWRETAARLLLEREDLGVVNALQDAAKTAKLPATRVAALHVLKGLKSLDQMLVSQALTDSDPRVRQQATVFAEQWLNANSDLRQQVLKLARDDNSRVRFQVALSLAPMAQGEVSELAHIAQLGAEDTWSRRAVAIAAKDIAGELLIAVLNNHRWLEERVSSGENTILSELITLAGKSTTEETLLKAVEQLLAVPDSENASRIKRIALQSLFQAFQRRGTSLTALLEKAENSQLRQKVEIVFDAARQLAEQPEADVVPRSEAILLLGYDPSSLDLLTTASLEEPAQAVRLAAIGALSLHDDLEPWKIVLEEFPSMRPAVRNRILSAVIARPDRAELLFEAIENEMIRVHEIDRVSAGQLIRHRDPATRERAKKILATAVPADRAKVLSDYQKVLELSSSPEHGREVFRKQCSTCHKVGDIGVKVGPDIGDNYARKKTQLLTDILQPNRAIDSNFLSYLVLTDDGQTLSGILLAETASSITLQQEQDKKVTLSKSEIEEIRSTGVSLMPDGMEKNIPHQDMADLLSFLKNWRYLDGLTPFSENLREK